MDEAAELAQALIRGGAGRSEAWGVVGWLIDPSGLAEASVNPYSAAVRQRQLRAKLGKIIEPPWPPRDEADAEARLANRTMGAYLDSSEYEPVDELALAS